MINLWTGIKHYFAQKTMGFTQRDQRDAGPLFRRQNERFQIPNVRDCLKNRRQPVFVSKPVWPRAARMQPAWTRKPSGPRCFWRWATTCSAPRLASRPHPATATAALCGKCWQSELCWQISITTHLCYKMFGAIYRQRFESHRQQRFIQMAEYERQRAKFTRSNQ
jgi:hypothetical protein